ncbi:MAG: SpoIIE family protein phosphatase [Clostridia bacterium]|nr:SpoIIE family protein phosphatase [Clostridia bacterium]
MKKGRRRITGIPHGEMAESLTAERGFLVKLKGTVSTAAEAVMQNRLMLMRTVLPVVYALLFGGVHFEMGIYPFGISAVCGAVAGAPAMLTAVGAAVSSLFVRGGFYIAAVCILAAGMLWLIKRFYKRIDGGVFRAVLSAAACAVQTFVHSAAGGISFYDVARILLSAAVCPVVTLCLRELFSAEGNGRKGIEFGIYVLLFTAVFTLGGMSYTGASAATVISMTASLYAAYAFGIPRGVMTGFAVGLAADPAYSLIYCTAAASAGVLMRYSPIAAVITGSLTALALAIRNAGASAFGELFPEIMFCIALTGPLFHYGLLPAVRTDTAGTSLTDINERRLSVIRDRLCALSDSLGAVSAVMRRMSKVFSRPSYAEVRQMCDDAFDESCYMCKDRGICWDREYRATASSLGRIAADIREGKTAVRASLTEGIRDRCPYADAIISRINVGAASTSRTAMAGDPASATADDYAAMSRLIDEVERDGEAELCHDPEGSEALARRYAEMGLEAEVSVYGGRRQIVYVRGLEQGCSLTGEELRSAAGSVLGHSFTEPDYAIDGRAVSLEMHTAERYSVSVGRSSVAKRGEQCGDSITSFMGGGGYFYTLISDGMGSGGAAAVTSGACAVFLERMLSAGCTLVTAAEMLNSFLLRRNMECFATLDLMEADLITGELRFLKSGAAPSFVLRGGKLFRLQSKTVPVGIVTPFDGEIISFTAKAGDFVIMLSDGVVPDGGECPWLCELLTSPGSRLGGDLKAAADFIAKAAADRSDFGDDVTVGIVKINEA